MKFVYLFSDNGMIIPISPERICYLDYRSDGDKRNPKMLVGHCVIILDNGHGVQLQGNPKDVAKEIEKQTQELVQ